MELLLPFAIAMFPNLLPSTFEAADKKVISLYSVTFQYVISAYSMLLPVLIDIKFSLKKEKNLKKV